MSTTALVALAALLMAVAPSQLSAGVPAEREWRFEVLLDDKPIGFHRFHLSGAGDTHQLHSEASFQVKILGLTVYDYKHQSTELWQNDCLQRIDAATDDNGEKFFVRGNGASDRLVLERQTDTASLPGCVMTFAYWNPVMLQQQRLLNAQTGDYTRVAVERLGQKKLEVQGRTVPALHYRIRTGERDIELWYSSDYDWLGLSSTIGGDRRLHYRRVDHEGTSGG